MEASECEAFFFGDVIFCTQIHVWNIFIQFQCVESSGVVSFIQLVLFRVQDDGVSMVPLHRSGHSRIRCLRPKP